MPTKLPTPSVARSQSFVLPKQLDAKRSVIHRLVLNRCLGRTMFILLLPLTTTLSSTAALARSGEPLNNNSYGTIQKPQLLAQQVIDGLPPPPPIPELQVPEDAALPQGSGPQTGSQEDTGDIYMVYVNGDSPLLLEQVQQVAPTARIQSLEGQQVILAGLFDRSSAANEQIEKLDERGIDANVASVSSVVLSPNAPSIVREDVESIAQQPSLPSLDELPPADPVSTVTQANSRVRPSVSVAPPSVAPPSVAPPSVAPQSVAPPSVVPPSVSSSSSSTTTVTNAPRRDNAYYVVIPGEEDELGAMWEQVILLGAVSNAVEQRDRPLGPHLLIGPFVNQDAATRWNRFFQDFGMDARVYYKR